MCPDLLCVCREDCRGRFRRPEESGLHGFPPYLLSIESPFSKDAHITSHFLFLLLPSHPPFSVTSTHRFNPLEQIIISSPEAGGNYTISVRAFNLVTPQDYALVISGQFSGFAYNETAGAFGPVRRERTGGKERRRGQRVGSVNTRDY